MTHLHDKISALVDGELKGSARDRALAHARRCAACRNEIANTLAVKQRLRGLCPDDPSPDLFAALGGLTPGRHEPDHARSVDVARRLVVGVGTMSVAVLTLAYAVGGPPSAAAVSPPVDEFSAEFAGTSGASPLADPAVTGLAGSDPVEDSASRPTGQLNPPEGRALLSTTTSFGDEPGDDEPGDDRRAAALLRAAAVAPWRVAYSGVREVISVGSERIAVMVRVQHVPGQGTSYQIFGAGIEQTTATFVAHREAATRGGFADGQVDLVLDSYDVTVADTDEVAGRPTTVIAATQDGVDVARFWVDDATGLLLRRETYDAGQLVRSSTFSAIRISSDGFIEHPPPELETPSATRLPMRTATVLHDQGWESPPSLGESFDLVVLHQVDADVVQAGYSDGLSTLSIFEERGELDTSTLAGFDAHDVGDGTVHVREGLPTVAVWEADGTVYTAVSDAPAGTFDDLLAELPHEPEDDGVSNRVGTGLGRIGSFLNPVD